MREKDLKKWLFISSCMFVVMVVFAFAVFGVINVSESTPPSCARVCCVEEWLNNKNAEQLEAILDSIDYIQVQMVKCLDMAKRITNHTCPVDTEKVPKLTNWRRSIIWGAVDESIYPPESLCVADHHRDSIRCEWPHRRDTISIPPYDYDKDFDEAFAAFDSIHVDCQPDAHLGVYPCYHDCIHKAGE